MPHRFYLPHALPNETVLLLLRRHWFVLFARMLLWTVAGAMPVGLAFLLPDVMGRAIAHSVGYPLMVIAASVYYLFIWLFAFNGFVDYYLDVWMVTNERIINIEQTQLFARTTAEQKLNRIQDVAAEINGILPTFLGYGDVSVQTAGEKSFFNFEQIPDPEGVARKISSLVENKRHAERAQPNPPPPV